ncbi:protein-tyrosine phosphatase family protein [Leekyejoonella antrihumi]|uniref:Protein phosphatase n=1 Tax=Leekyejoonella antrihumi TaxID=1660198 RepID=A0A563E1G0_9MICO|nr:protein-tyrosine phosphatase family protein [Leekyejoonella antrihumi]TWP36370.1 protein phosphatase [Leekyejoonella antrihumi]
MGTRWDPLAAGVLRLPSGRLVRGRGLSRPLPSGLLPDWGAYLFGEPPPSVGWESIWVRWPDFGLPDDNSEFAAAVRELWDRSIRERVEVACYGGHGRTGTALACAAILDGVPADSAVAYVREHYDQGAVETEAQADYVLRFDSMSRD